MTNTRASTWELRLPWSLCLDKIFVPKQGEWNKLHKENDKQFHLYVALAAYYSYKTESAYKIRP